MLGGLISRAPSEVIAVRGTCCVCGVSTPCLCGFCFCFVLEPSTRLGRVRDLPRDCGLFATLDPVTDPRSGPSSRSTSRCWSRLSPSSTARMEASREWPGCRASSTRSRSCDCRRASQGAQLGIAQVTDSERRPASPKLFLKALRTTPSNAIESSKSGPGTPGLTVRSRHCESPCHAFHLENPPNPSRPRDRSERCPHGRLVSRERRPKGCASGRRVAPEHGHRGRVMRKEHSPSRLAMPIAPVMLRRGWCEIGLHVVVEEAVSPKPSVAIWAPPPSVDYGQARTPQSVELRWPRC